MPEDPEEVPVREALRLILEERADEGLPDALQYEVDLLEEDLNPELRIV